MLALKPLRSTIVVTLRSFINLAYKSINAPEIRLTRQGRGRVSTKVHPRRVVGNSTYRVIICASVLKRPEQFTARVICTHKRILFSRIGLLRHAATCRTADVDLVGIDCDSGSSIVEGRPELPCPQLITA